MVMKMGPWFIVSSERLEEQRIKPVILGLQWQYANHCTTATPFFFIWVPLYYFHLQGIRNDRYM